MPDGETVFVVEDDANFRQALVWLLEGAGHRSRAFATARDFLDQIAPEIAGCLITDLCMPEVSGIQLLERLRDMGVAIPAIVVTGHGSIPASVRAMKLGAIDFLEKPFGEQQLLGLVAQGLEQDRAGRQSARERQNLVRALASLSPREDAVLRAALAGRAIQQIADGLGIGVKSVETYRLRILQKAGQPTWVDLRVALERLDVSV